LPDSQTGGQGLEGVLFTVTGIKKLGVNRDSSVVPPKIGLPQNDNFVVLRITPSPFILSPKGRGKKDLGFTRIFAGLFK
jgi:hypothetical protein